MPDTKLLREMAIKRGIRGDGGSADDCYIRGRLRNLPYLEGIKYGMPYPVAYTRWHLLILPEQFYQLGIIDSNL